MNKTAASEKDKQMSKTMCRMPGLHPCQEETAGDRLLVCQEYREWCMSLLRRL